MNTLSRAGKKTCILLGLALWSLWPAFGNAQESSKTLAIGIVTDDASLSQHIDQFKAGMAELGYAEDKNIRYVFYGFVEDESRIDNIDTQMVLADNPDLIFTLGNAAAIWAKKAVGGTGIPALFSMISSDPVNEGMVESLSFPKGNMTGIRVPDIIPKALEWLMETVPGIKKVFLPYNPADEVSVIALNGLNDAASKLGVELLVHKINTVEEAIAAIETLPEDIDAIFRIPSQTLDPRNNELAQAAIKRKLPMGATHNLDESVLVSFRPDIARTGRQAARLANQILRGARPADLPIETLEVTLVINLKVAEKIGIHVPNSVLVNADSIIR